MYIILFFHALSSILPSGWIKGDPNRLLYSVDSNGRLCGRDAAVQSVTVHSFSISYSQFCLLFFPEIVRICCSSI